MSDFEPSPRSSKRRKTTRYGSGSAKAIASPSVYRGISNAVTGISRRLFKPTESEDELADESRPNQLRDSAYASKDDSLNDEAEAATTQLNGRRAGGSESADELAEAEVTISPAKPKVTLAEEGEQTPKPRKSTAESRSADEELAEIPRQTRSSGRERKRPRRFSNSCEDISKPVTPKGILTPSRKGNKGLRKSVAFESRYGEAEDSLGFKDVDKATVRPAKTPRQKKGKRTEDNQNTNEHAENHDDGVINDAPSKEGVLEDDAMPDMPELPDITPSMVTEVSDSITDSRLDPIKSLILSRLTGRSLTPLTNLDDEYSKLHSLLSATVMAGEGNSILLLGSRGVGKTCLVETALAELATEHADDFHVVRLNGFVQTDDKLALREIWRQLGREMQVEEDETAQVSSYADTMASLLHLLSHPEELAETFEPDGPTKTTKSVVFVLDEFDLFTTHPRQTLLYNLFDIAQTRKAPIAVIGCSARVDVSDNLEKRVKSRFSHRWLHLSQAKSLVAFEEIVKAALMLREQDGTGDSRGIPKKLQNDWNGFVEVG
jgi:origin recognition complex subunit 4